MTGQDMPTLLRNARLGAPSLAVDEKQHSGTGASRKILFLGCSFTGHFTPLLQLMRWHHEQGGWEVHMVPQTALLPKIPEWVVVHRPFEDRATSGFFEALFAKIGSEASDWSSSFVQLLSALGDMPTDAIAQQQKDAMEVIRELSPSVVVADFSWNIGNHMHTFCTGLGVPLAALLCPGRPDPAAGTLSILWLLFRYGGLGKLRRVLSAIGRLEALMRPVSGAPLPDSNKPLMLLPGTDALLQSPPAPHELVCGPFLSLPPPCGASGFQRPAAALGASSLAPELRRWLAAEPGRPIVYVAFGSLAKLTASMATRVAEALRSPSWRVLWVLDETTRALLPAEHQSSDSQWRLEPWVAQRDVLGFEGVRCFLSHCGANSSLEALSVGVPMVCMPFFCDHFEWASAISGHAKAGVLVHKFRSGPSEIRAAVRQVLEDPEVAGAALRLAQEIRRESRLKSAMVAGGAESAEGGPGVAVAAGLIAELADGKDPRRRFEPACAASSGAGGGVLARALGAYACRSK